MSDPTPAEIGRGHEIVAANSDCMMRCPKCGNAQFGGDGKTNTCQGDDGCGRTTPYDDWLTDEISGDGEAMAASITRALADQRERDARLHDSVDPHCDHEKPGQGAGAMGAVIRYRDAIRQGGA